MRVVVSLVDSSWAYSSFSWPIARSPNFIRSVTQALAPVKSRTILRDDNLIVSGSFNLNLGDRWLGNSGSILLLATAQPSRASYHSLNVVPI